MTSGGWVNPLLCKRFKAILANVVCFSRCVLGVGLLVYLLIFLISDFAHMDTSLGGVTIIRRYLYEDDLIVNLLSLHELRGEGLEFVIVR
ncbi:hypothetical protein SLEP1_g36890 [Rubroshorea leprosula]|uniref:Uncharacterized protein n=1 Tax=Rubroshorea leprosula TaxID=152421 RepID=A0AAV5KTC9_9ROSI|nr:hypothetical protein SLEP1_g36890 [Rubroshorea leprosula]